MESPHDEKIKRFLNDSIMAEAVYGVLLQSFLKQQDRKDIHMLAASRIAIDLLDDAWKELKKRKNAEVIERRPLKQNGM